jgi:hypothetical protein
MIKIAISGKANSGKNTLSKLIIKEIKNMSTIDNISNLISYQVAFADPIKKIAKTMFPQIPKKHLFGPSLLRNEIIFGAFKDLKPLTVRQTLIDIGTSSRLYNNDIWVENLKNRLEVLSLKDDFSIFIVPDLRFRNEFDFLKKNDFFFIRIKRDCSSNINHESEIGQESILDSEFDHIISNNGTLKNLKEEVIKIIHKLNFNS